MNDARAVKDLLEERGVRVWYFENCSIYELRYAMYGFLHSLQKDDVALVYFAGHAVDSGGTLRLEALPPPRGPRNRQMRDNLLSLQHLTSRFAKHRRGL